MIAILYAPPSGNAVRIALMPPSGAEQMRILRRDDQQAIVGPDDPNAWKVYEGPVSPSVLDWEYVQNDIPLRYAVFYRSGGGAWQPGNQREITVSAPFQDESIDVLTLVRDRLELGLRVLVERGELSHPAGYIPVMTASPLIDEVALPLVTVHVASDSPDTVVGSLMTGEERAGNAVTARDGWLSRVALTIMGWSLNADERLALRRAIKAVLIANMDVFAEVGLADMEAQFSDQEDFQSYSAPVYQVVCSFSCVAPSVVASDAPAVNDLTAVLNVP